MERPLFCANECDSVCGSIIYSTQESPEEIEPWDEDLVDEDGNCFCSSECYAKFHAEDEND